MVNIVIEFNNITEYTIELLNNARIILGELGYSIESINSNKSYMWRIHDKNINLYDTIDDDETSIWEYSDSENPTDMVSLTEDQLYDFLNTINKKIEATKQTISKDVNELNKNILIEQNNNNENLETLLSKLFDLYNLKDESLSAYEITQCVIYSLIEYINNNDVTDLVSKIMNK